MKLNEWDFERLIDIVNILEESNEFAADILKTIIKKLKKEW